MLRRCLVSTVLAVTGLVACAGSVASAHTAGHRDPARQIIDLDHGTVVVYEDGRVYRRAEMGDWYTPSGIATPRRAVRMAPPPPPGAYEWATLSDDAVDELVERIDELGLLDDELDFGDPMITDSPSSDLVVIVDGERIDHHVYAPGYDEGLTAEQQANRAGYAELRALLFELDDTFGDELSKFAPFVPDEWVVRVGGYWSGEVDRPWPLDTDPVDGDCVVLPGDDEADTATGGYLFRGDIVVADAALPNDPRCN